jgi:hypothetical protein
MGETKVPVPWRHLGSFYCVFFSYCEILCLCALACRRVQSTDFELFSYVVDHYLKGFSGQLSFIFRMDLFFKFFCFCFASLVSGKVSRPTAATPQQTQPQPQKARQFVQTQPVKRTSLSRPVSADLTRSSSMGFLNQVKKT